MKNAILKKIDDTLASFDEKYSDQDKFQQEMEQESEAKLEEAKLEEAKLDDENKSSDESSTLKDKAIELTEKIKEKF